MSAQPEFAGAQSDRTVVPSEDEIGSLSLRFVLLGLALVLVLDAVAIHVRYVYRGSLMTYSHVPMAMLMVLIRRVNRCGCSGKFTCFSISTPRSSYRSSAFRS